MTRPHALPQVRGFRERVWVVRMSDTFDHLQLVDQAQAEHARALGFEVREYKLVPEHGEDDQAESEAAP